MIATCNIKVNGRWVRAGEEYEPETVVTSEKAQEPKAKAEIPEKVHAEETEPKAEPRPRTTSARRRTSK